jgi:hypothetical protein
MKRDGNCISLWQDNMPDFTGKETDTNDIVFDVLIVGGGITGITSGLLLQKSGMQVAIAEARNICLWPQQPVSHLTS